MHITTEAVALEGAPPALLPGTTAAHATLQLMDTPITPCTVIPIGIVAPPSCTHHFSTQAPLTLLSRLEPVSLQQLLSPSTRFSAQED